MIEHQLTLQPGVTYSAAAELPWYVSRGMVESYLEKKGFGPVTWHEASDMPPLVPPPGVEPTPWAQATYQGAPGLVLELPEAVRWVHSSAPSPAKPTAGETGPAPGGPAPITLAPTKKSGAELPIALAAAAVFADVLVFGLVFKKIRDRKKAPTERKSHVSPFTLALLGVGGFFAFNALAGKKAVASPGAQKAIADYQLNDLTDEQLFTLGMNPPTADIYLTEGVLYLLQKRGRGDLYTGVWNAARARISAQQAGITASAEAAQAAEAAGASRQ